MVAFILSNQNGKFKMKI